VVGVGEPGVLTTLKAPLLTILPQSQSVVIGSVTLELDDSSLDEQDIAINTIADNNNFFIIFVF